MSERKEWQFEVSGMTCDHCARSIDALVQGTPGVVETHTSYASGRVIVVAESSADPTRIAQAIEEKGYKVVGRASRDLPTERKELPTGPSVDLTILGGGSAAFAAAIRAADLGFRAQIVEAATMGGTCVNVGCIPSKAMIRAAEKIGDVQHNPFAGLDLSARLTSYAAVVAQKDALVSALRQAKYADVLEAYPSVSYVQGTASLAEGGRLTIDGKPVPTSKILIATGARPWEPPIPGLSETPHWNSTDALAATALPRHLVVIGAGALGIELAQMFLQMGAEVTLLEALPGVVPNEDGDVQEALAAALREEGMRIEVGIRVAHVGGRPGAYEIAIEAGERRGMVHSDALLVATGRRANTASLGLAEAGICTNERGAIVVNEFQKTTNPDVYAAGDVTGDPMFVYVSAHAGAVAAENALLGDRVRRDLRGMPRVTFTTPAVASVGMTEAEARRSGAEVLSSKLGLEHVPRAIAARDTRGFIKLVVDAKTRLLLGAHVLAPEAGETIQECVMAIRHGITVDELARTMHPYLTYAEGIKLASQALGKDVRTLSCCAS